MWLVEGQQWFANLKINLKKKFCRIIVGRSNWLYFTKWVTVSRWSLVALGGEGEGEGGGAIRILKRHTYRFPTLTTYFLNINKRKKENIKTSTIIMTIKISNAKKMTFTSSKMDGMNRFWKVKENTKNGFMDSVGFNKGNANFQAILKCSNFCFCFSTALCSSFCNSIICFGWNTEWGAKKSPN